MKKRFTKNLLKWFSTNQRPMPWKGEKDPYLIWLSEIILQQTRVEQGLPYYQKFKKQYPSVMDLANASEDEVMKSWEGLGYYSRARNLHATAKFIANDLNGIFPDTHNEILALKGVGPYTAAAIASFAYDLPYAVVDGNVYRVLSRYFGIEEPIDSTKGKKDFAKLAQELLDINQPGNYNQAIMDFGATFCTPKQAQCKKCLMRKDCKAFQNKSVDKFPIKSKKIKKRTRYFNYLVLNEGDKVYIKKRVGKDIWQHLYEFKLLESEVLLEKKSLMVNPKFIDLFGKKEITFSNISKPFQQTLTHQKIIAVFWEVEINKSVLSLDKDYLKVERKKLNSYAFPKVIDWYLRDNSLYLELS